MATVSRSGLARLSADGNLDLAYAPNANSVVWSTAVQKDGKAVVAGFFTTIGGMPRNRVARIETDGTLDAAFNPNANDDVRSLALQADGSIVIGGNFTVVWAGCLGIASPG